jgi:hypothetical protein
MQYCREDFKLVVEEANIPGIVEILRGYPDKLNDILEEVTNTTLIERCLCSQLARSNRMTELHCIFPVRKDILMLSNSF